MNEASLFPALEKACPKHRNLMNRLYHKRHGNISDLPLSVLTEDEMDRVIDVIADYPHPRGLTERILRLRYNTVIDQFSPYLDARRMLNIVRIELKCVMLNTRYRAQMLEFFESTSIAPRVLFEHIDQCVAIINQSDSGSINLLFDSDVAAVAAKLQLSDFVVEN